VWGNFVPEVGQFAPAGSLILHLYLEPGKFAGEILDLLLLAENSLVELVDQIFGVAQLDFDIVQSGFHGGCSAALFITPVVQGFTRWWQLG
jgi:hypothetical protein